ncbi:MAG: arsenite methyltransferase [Dehalococcoidia bacterium]|nr:arsenite methyltransferase [Dehalococcoidia bacterium]
MEEIERDQIRKAVRDNYASVVRSGGVGCGCGPSCCGGTTDPGQARDKSAQMGYSEDELACVPEGADLGLGCGNPQAIAALKAGEIVLDLGSGAGFDCFLAARAVGEMGKVIGVDMTPDMLSKARANAKSGGYGNVEFRLGEIEHLPVADASADVILSNCVINLSPDKPAVFREAFRVLKKGGRLAISDVVATALLPEELRKELSLYTGCVSGAATIDENERMLTEAGFKNIRINPKDESRQFIRNWSPGNRIEDYVVSATIEAVKP